MVFHFRSLALEVTKRQIKSNYYRKLPKDSISRRTKNLKKPNRGRITIVRRTETRTQQNWDNFIRYLAVNCVVYWIQIQKQATKDRGTRTSRGVASSHQHPRMTSTMGTRPVLILATLLCVIAAVLSQGAPQPQPLAAAVKVNCDTIR